MARRKLYLPVLIAAAVLVACSVALLVALSEKAEATFPGKNGKIAYVGGGVIYTINPGGGGTTKVTRGGDEPSYSPNGKRIAYSSWDGHDFEIYTIKVGGGGKKQVTDNNNNYFSPSYSPDGKKIAFTCFDGNDNEICTRDSRGRGKRFQLTKNDRVDFAPSYSPNGKRIAYDGYDGNDYEIYTIDVGGKGKFQVTKNGKGDAEPSYSPDGKKIAYTGYKTSDDSDDEDYNSEIYTIKVGGGGRSRVTDTRGGIYDHAQQPSWGSRP